MATQARRDTHAKMVLHVSKVHVVLCMIALRPAGVQTSSCSKLHRPQQTKRKNACVSDFLNSRPGDLQSVHNLRWTDLCSPIARLRALYR